MPSYSHFLASVVPSNCLPYIDEAWTYRKHVSCVRMRGADNIENIASSVVAKARLPRCCLSIEVFVIAGIYLATRSLAMYINVKVFLGIMKYRERQMIFTNVLRNVEIENIIKVAYRNEM
jgi:hypothetical protein